MFARVLLAALMIGGAGIALAPVAEATGRYRNCTEAHADGRWDIPKGDPDYWDGGDRDRDGFACDS